MFRIVLIIAFWLLAPFTSKVFAGSKDVVIRNYTVNGVCDQCKKRIEDASYIKGVKFAEWSIDNHSLTVKFDSVKTSPDIILKTIAGVGHDSERFIATQEDYDKLPACCKYRSGIKKH
jgi:periplasmic mercuric ion binding protein